MLVVVDAYISGTHKWNGAVYILNNNPINKNNALKCILIKTKWLSITSKSLNNKKTSYIDKKPVQPYMIDIPNSNNKEEKEDKIKYLILASIEYRLYLCKAIKILILMFCNSNKIKISIKCIAFKSIKELPNVINNIMIYSKEWSLNLLL